MKFYGATPIIFLFGIIACNALSKCRCGHFGDGVNACHNSDKSYGKSRGIVIRGFNHDESNHYAAVAAIQAASTARKIENKVYPTSSLAAGSNEKHRLGGFGSCKSSSSSSALHSDIDNNKCLHKAVSDLTQLSKDKRIVPKFEKISLAAQPLSPLAGSLAFSVRVRPATPNRPKCSECGGSTKHASSCRAARTGILGANVNSYNQFSQLSGLHGFKNFQTLPFFKINTNLNPFSPNPNILKNFHETVGYPGIPFSEQEEIYRNDVSTPYSKIPADPVSQHLYRQSLLQLSNKKEKVPVSEAKLYFGPLSHPQNNGKNKTIIGAEEAKLFNVHKPIIEFVTETPHLSNCKTRQGRKDDRELSESLHRERLHQATNTPDVSNLFQPTFSELGYTRAQPNGNEFLARDSTNVPYSNWLRSTGVGVSPDQSLLLVKEDLHGHTRTHDYLIDRSCDDDNLSGSNRSNDESIQGDLGDADENYRTGRVDSDTTEVMSFHRLKNSVNCYDNDE